MKKTCVFFYVTNWARNDNIISKFESLSFNEKLDMFSEIVIRYDNETYFKDKITILTFDSKSNGFDIAKIIQ